MSTDAVPVPQAGKCPECGAPAQVSVVREFSEEIAPGMEFGGQDKAWRFDAERFLRENIAALTDEQLNTVAREVLGLRDHDPIYPRERAGLRAALVATLGEPTTP